MQSIPRQSLQSGDKIPLLGIGTAKLDSGTVRTTVESALEAGYTLIDTAEGYENERAVGDAIAAYDRDDLFLTSKVLPSHLHYESVIESCEASLDLLGTTYLDLYLVHWPNPAISLRATLDAMSRLYERGVVRNVGVSNFSEYYLRFACRLAEVPISVNQIECHPWWPQRSLQEFCRANDVVVTAAAPLGQTRPLDDPVIRDLAAKYGKKPAQIVLRWLVQQDVVSIPRSSSTAHIDSNARLFDWKLDDDDIKRVDSIERREKVYDHEINDRVYGTPR